MCIAIPSKIVSIDTMSATVDVYGARREVSLMLMPEAVAKGDYVFVHAGYAIQKVYEEAANESLQLLQELLQNPEFAEDPF
ncbi:MAG: HypC/HybG/HupF family hydrogenase formation chaperone [Deltaproteobacteria bacterium]